MRGVVGGQRLALGNTALMQDEKIEITPLLGQAEELRKTGASVMFLAVDGKLSGLLAVADPIKSTTAEALTQLRNEGVRIVMATGDGWTTARAVAASFKSTR